VKRLLVATAVDAERDAVLAGLPAGMHGVTVVAVGVGPAAAAAGTCRLLTLAEAGGSPYSWVISAGIAGGIAARTAIGGTVVAARSIAADLGAESPDGFLSLAELGFGTTVHEPDPTVLRTLRTALPGATIGDVLTGSTVTGTAASAESLTARHPGAVAEAMEGYGVAAAALECGVGFAELRTISNLIGPRDRAAWRVRDALAALTTASATALPAVAALA
jgi:futalosine hydrolase